MSDTLAWTANRLAFGLRRRLRWGRGPYREPAESKAGLFDGRTDAEALNSRAAALISTYDLDAFARRSSRVHYLESLTHLDYLTQLLAHSANLPSPCRWLDVGSKNAAYFTGISAWLRQAVSDFTLTGVELDGYRLYADLHTRAEYAQAFCAGIPEARYVVGDVRDIDGTYDVISWFLPFIFEDTCRAWGLPRSQFAPEALLSHVIGLLSPGGTLLMINQGKAEAEAQADLLAPWLNAAGGPLRQAWHGTLAPSFIAYQVPRVGRCLVKNL